MKNYLLLESWNQTLLNKHIICWVVIRSRRMVAHNGTRDVWITQSALFIISFLSLVSIWFWMPKLVIFIILPHKCLILRLEGRGRH
ncbi:hypothetical protein ASPWEDRAFT_241017 [Aspergillus wentii DTO 134E9]|uniref:Uncharacterized protein n=1 Tax=Aspergillus wentii DTO 134E9 TaxID=1073089 RepID=A0A1L9S1H5_ASPWE|nr:uncharacterized protein ASPWEDRAFT_241017 [Aspergillus wentii DTO 134E9]OJJ41005.1 hypothetical protein ASPWEDRAFT_241017 [Aspergillus wentii DTO 134E9]